MGTVQPAIEISLIFTDEAHVDLLHYERRMFGHLCDGCIEDGGRGVG